MYGRTTKVRAAVAIGAAVLLRAATLTTARVERVHIDFQGFVDSVIPALAGLPFSAGLVVAPSSFTSDADQ